MPRLLELFCGTKSVGRAFEAAGWEVVSLDIVSKFEPTILRDIRSWDYTTFPGHFDSLHGIQLRADDAPATAPGGRRAEIIADAAVDQHALEAEAEPVQARQPLRRVAGRQAPPGRAAGAAADGGAVREGQPITRAAPQRSCRAVRGDCARGHGGAWSG